MDRENVVRNMNAKGKIRQNPDKYRLDLILVKDHPEFAAEMLLEQREELEILRRALQLISDDEVDYPRQVAHDALYKMTDLGEN